MRTLKNHRLGQHYAHSIMLSGARPFQYRKSVSRLMNTANVMAISRPVDFFHAMGLHYLHMPQNFVTGGSQIHSSSISPPMTTDPKVHNSTISQQGINQNLTEKSAQDTKSKQLLGQQDGRSQSSPNRFSDASSVDVQSFNTSLKPGAEQSSSALPAHKEPKQKTSNQSRLRSSEVGDFLAQLGQSLENHNRTALSGAPPAVDQNQSVLNSRQPTDAQHESHQSSDQSNLSLAKQNSVSSMPQVQRKAKNRATGEQTSSVLNRSFNLESSSETRSKGPSSFSIETSEYSAKPRIRKPITPSDEETLSQKPSIHRSQVIQDTVKALPELPANTNDYRQIAHALSQYVQPASLSQDYSQDPVGNSAHPVNERQPARKNARQTVVTETRQVRQTRVAAPVNARESSFQRHYCGHSNIRMYKW